MLSLERNVLTSAIDGPEMEIPDEPTPMNTEHLNTSLTMLGSSLKKVFAPRDDRQFCDLLRRFDEPRRSRTA